jgi:hypothetical protein
MRFEKGNSMGGRKVGSKNKITQDIREAFKKLIEDNIDGLQNDLDSLDPKDRLRLIIDISQYVIPRLKQTDVSADITSNNNESLLNKLLEIPEEKYNDILKNDKSQMK